MRFWFERYMPSVPLPIGSVVVLSPSCKRGETLVRNCTSDANSVCAKAPTPGTPTAGRSPDSASVPLGKRHTNALVPSIYMLFRRAFTQK